MVFESKAKDISNIELKISHGFDKNTMQRKGFFIKKDNENKIVKLIDEKVMQLRNEVNKE